MSENNNQNPSLQDKLIDHYLKEVAKLISDIEEIRTLEKEENKAFQEINKKIRDAKIAISDEVTKIILKREKVEDQNTLTSYFNQMEADFVNNVMHNVPNEISKIADDAEIRNIRNRYIELNNLKEQLNVLRENIETVKAEKAELEASKKVYENKIERIIEGNVLRNDSIVDDVVRSIQDLQVFTSNWIPFLKDLVKIATTSELKAHDIVKIPANKPSEWSTLVAGPLFIRKVYGEIYDEMQKESRYHLLLGTAGIGKTRFILYYILRKLKEFIEKKNKNNTDNVSFALYIGNVKGNGELSFSIMFAYDGIEFSFLNPKLAYPKHVLIDSTGNNLNFLADVNDENLRPDIIFVGSPGTQDIGTELCVKTSPFCELSSKLIYTPTWTLEEVKNYCLTSELDENVSRLYEFGHYLFGGSMRLINAFVRAAGDYRMPDNMSTTYASFKYAFNKLVDIYISENYDQLVHLRTDDEIMRFKKIHLSKFIYVVALFMHQGFRRPGTIHQPNSRISNLFCHIATDIEFESCKLTWSSECFITIYAYLLYQRANEPSLQFLDKNGVLLGELWETHAIDSLFRHGVNYSCTRVRDGTVQNFGDLFENGRLNMNMKFINENNINHFSKGDFCAARKRNFAGIDGMVCPNLLFNFTINGKHTEAEGSRFNTFLDKVKEHFKLTNESDFNFVYIVPDDYTFKILLKKAKTFKRGFNYYVMNMQSYSNLVTRLRNSLNAYEGSQTTFLE